MSSGDPEAVRLRLDQVSDRLRKEVDSDSTTETPRVSISITSPTTPSGAPIVALDRPEFLRSSWKLFESEQNTAIADLIAKGVTGDDELKLHQSGPSLHEQCVFTSLPEIRVLTKPGMHAHRTRFGLQGRLSANERLRRRRRRTRMISPDHRPPILP